ncbi:hypothetical protein CASFOL_011062 [Castilleja foliolosa]|uniref:Uncharacterized protein n=1 Tax=Castilleja foliolosa TaxID=1961234 RepID=A0ABD3DUZ9_9LAMI
MNNNEESDENNSSETESDYDSDESDTAMVDEKIECLRQLLPNCFKESLGEGGSKATANLCPSCKARNDRSIDV